MPSQFISRRNFLTVLAAAGAVGGCTRAAFVAANLPTHFGAHTRLGNLVYGSNARHRLDVYLPARVASNKLVIFWHGGRWSSGNKSDYQFVGAALAAAGYVAVLPNYRLYPQVKLAGFMDDAARAADWAALHASRWGADSNQVILMGHSSGAHMAALLALNPKYLLAVRSSLKPVGVIGLSGPYDFLPLREAYLQDMFGPPDRYAESQPINFVSRAAPPMLLIHGDKDEVVNPQNTRNLAAKLSAAGVAVTLRMYPTLDHADTVAALSLLGRGRAPILHDIEDFVAG
jgi:acetyl esterase/lipase